MTHCINVRTANVNPTMETTTRSVKVDRIDINSLYGYYNTQTVDEFKKTCIEAIEQSSGKKTTKARFVAGLNQLRTKDRMLTTVNNYWLAGQGLKV